MKYNGRKISMVVIRRLPRYYRYLGDLLSAGITRISSKDLSDKMNVTASQIRQDLNCFGGFGLQGYGYNVEELHKEIGNILGLAKPHNAIVIGAGFLGHALVNHRGFSKRGFNITAMFDTDKEKIGQELNGIKIYDMSVAEQFVKDNKVDIAILALPKDSTKEVCDKLISYGIKGFLNFSYMDITVPKDVAVENVHLSDSLMTLSYRLNQISEE